ncbi:MAG: DnaJ domain-containing protein [Tissierellia bacterium]|nr:DnaJ domain-containing protein [Tissierellia bacterium]
MKKLWGKFLFGLSRFLEIVFDGLIRFSEFIIFTGKLVRGFFLPFILVAAVSFFMFPPLFLIFLTQWGITLFVGAVLIMLIPVIGKKLSNSLEYAKYVVTEYLYDYSDYYRFDKNVKGRFSDYSNKYYRKKDEEYRRKTEERQRQESERWQKIFEEFYRQQRQYGEYNRGYRNYGGNSNQYNPFSDFKSKYEKACDILGVHYNTDIYEVKLNYRKLAKKYHPDLNSERDAAEKFKEITDAYEFLSEDNINRYKNM